MDKNITPQAWRAITSSAWEDNFKELIKIKMNFSGINFMSIYIPYAVTNKYPIEFVDTRIPTTLSLYDIMTLYIREEHNKKVCGMKLSFPGKYKEQRTTRLPNYFYKWNTKEVTITKLIATVNVADIEKQALELFTECRRFNFMYCE